MKPAEVPAVAAARMVPCPGCGQPSVFASSNVYRPFCSARCRQIDLGAWAAEHFALPSSSAPDAQAPSAH